MILSSDFSLHLTDIYGRRWQKLRAAELKAQRNSNEDALARLTTRERELRNKIEDIRYPQSRSGTALKFSLMNANAMEENRKRGKKKNVTASISA